MTKPSYNTVGPAVIPGPGRPSRSDGYTLVLLYRAPPVQQHPSSRRTQHLIATDDDAPRTRDEDEPANESLEAIQARTSAATQSAVIDAEFFDTAEGNTLPGADLSHEELTIQVVLEQLDEFTCASCFLVRHRCQLARPAGGTGYCSDCEG